MELELLQRLAHFGTTRPAANALRQIDFQGRCERSLTYGQLCRAVEELAKHLHPRIPQGSVVILCHPNEIEAVVVFLATLAAGSVAFPVHPNPSDSELRAAAENSAAVAVSGAPHTTQVLAECNARPIDASAVIARVLTNQDLDGPSDFLRRSSGSEGDGGHRPGLLLQSSGTTGLPKIVCRDRAALDAVARGIVKCIGLSTSDRVLGLVPTCHAYGVEHVVLAPLYAGASVHLCSQLEPRALLQYLDSANITVFPGVPSMFEMLVRTIHEDRPLRSLRRAYSAGAALPVSLFDAFARQFGVPLGQLYGMTEVGSVTFNDPSLPGFDPSSVGLPMEGVRVRIVDRITRDLTHALPPGADGEVAISAPSMLCGYVSGPSHQVAQTTGLSDGFLMTGDQGHLDSLGHLFLTGRLKLVVDIGGQKVNLLEVEALLRDHPDVHDCVVVPVSVSETVSRLKAMIIPATPESPPSVDTLRAHLRSRLSPHKVPRVFELHHDLPRSAGGKILRHRLH